ncbi:MAG TPA: hypothetical protein VHC68_02860 [Candidatus Paceibacterota bacterium]|nr:hypothetical protein [Candidatus Paceibacterota bacterium]
MPALKPEEITALGVVFSSHAMDNGETRHRVLRQGYGYILTIMPPDGGGWQNSHYHKEIKEQYTVQEGWICYACLVPGGNNGGVSFKIYTAGQTFTTGTEPHNVYMPGGAVIHTVKHGMTSLEKDWFPSPELDLLTKEVSENELRRRIACG